MSDSLTDYEGLFAENIDSILERPLVESRLCVVFATPSLEHRVSLEYFGSYLRTTDVLREAGVMYGGIQVGGDPFIAKARNRLIADFFSGFPDASHLFFIDDDLGWPAEAPLRLLQSGRPVVAGVYPQKLDNPSYAVELDFREEHLWEDGGLLRANFVPAGFLCVTREVLEELATASPKYEEIGADGQTRLCPEVFRAGLMPNGKWTGEDYQFCQRVRDLGHEIWIDPSISFTHSGRKQFSGSLQAQVQTFLDSQKEAA